MKTNTIKKTELDRANALEAAGEHADAAQVRTMAEKDFPEAMPRTAHDLLPGDTADQYKPAVSEYDQQAQDFLTKHGIKFRATLSDSKTPAWAKDGEECGHHYRVTLSKRATYKCHLCGKPTPYGVCEPCIACGVMNEPAKRLVFDFWGSISDAQCQCCKGKKTVKLDKSEPIQVPNPKAGQKFNMGNERQPMWYTYPATLASWKRETECPRCKGTGHDPEPKHPSTYSVLACISGDAYTPETFADFCAEYGYEVDSIKALQTFRRVDRFAKRLRAFFTESELQDLSEIQ
jgi:hypothetical protein